MTVNLLVISGSSRTGSYNRKLAAIAAASAQAQGAQVTELDLRDLGLPVYDADIEAKGHPEGALELRRLFAAHEGLIVSAPEYNGFVTPLLLNSLDWASRVPAGDGLPDGLGAMGGTVVGLLSASPGGYGGIRGLIALRPLLQMNLGMMIVPATQSVPRASDAFDDAGQLKDAKQQHGVERVVAAVIRTAEAMKGG